MYEQNIVRDHHTLWTNFLKGVGQLINEFKCQRMYSSKIGLYDLQKQYPKVHVDLNVFIKKTMQSHTHVFVYCVSAIFNEGGLICK